MPEPKRRSSPEAIRSKRLRVLQPSATVDDLNLPFDLKCQSTTSTAFANRSVPLPICADSSWTVRYRAGTNCLFAKLMAVKFPDDPLFPHHEDSITHADDLR